MQKKQKKIRRMKTKKKRIQKKQEARTQPATVEKRESKAHTVRKLKLSELANNFSLNTLFLQDSISHKLKDDDFITFSPESHVITIQISK